jgi:hypothetical protein
MHNLLRKTAINGLRAMRTHVCLRKMCANIEMLSRLSKRWTSHQNLSYLTTHGVKRLVSWTFLLVPLIELHISM